MPDGEIKRAGRAGVVVEFRDYITMDLLWEAPMLYLPVKDDIVTYALDDEEPVEYEVMSVKFRFRKHTHIGYDLDENPIETIDELCIHEPTVFVKPGT
jgi:hypothetical protein